MLTLVSQILESNVAASKGAGAEEETKSQKSVKISDAPPSGEPEKKPEQPPPAQPDQPPTQGGNNPFG